MTPTATRRNAQDERFFILFQQLACKGVEAATRFRLLIEDYGSLEGAVAEIRLIEHEADVLVHELEARLNAALITPLDREDIHALTMRLDDVVDHIEATTDRLMLFRVEAPTRHLMKIALVLLRATEEVERSIAALMRGDRNALRDHCHQINEAENEADQLLREAFRHLFSGDVPTLDVIKLKEIYDFIELATDACEDVADVLIGAVSKSSA